MGASKKIDIFLVTFQKVKFSRLIVCKVKHFKILYSFILILMIKAKCS